MREPYIGITGFTKRQQVEAALDGFPKDAGQRSGRKLMVGVLASWKSLRGFPLKEYWAKRTPDFHFLRDILMNDERALNLIHYSCDSEHSWDMARDMLTLTNFAPNCHGFQLNVTFPEIGQLEDYRKAAGSGPRIALQIGRGIIEALTVVFDGNLKKGVVQMLYQYAPLVNDILIDMSGGMKKPLDVFFARTIVEAVAEKHPNLGIGVGGGLGPGKMEAIEPLLREYPNLSWDAEGAVRDDANEMSPARFLAYRDQSLQLLRTCAK